MGHLSVCIVAFASIDNNNIETGISYLFTTGGVEQNLEITGHLSLKMLLRKELSQ
jgi:hypothetical protein